MTHDRARATGERVAADAEPFLDLTVDSGLLAHDFADVNPDGFAALLEAVNLTDVGAAQPVERAVVLDLAIYRATGSTHLAELFCREFRPCR